MEDNNFGDFGYHSYNPSTGHGLPRNPMNAIVAPRPIGWVSTVDRAGVRNLAPYSFFNLLCSQPPLVGLSSDGWKDTVANIEASREFVCNVASFGQALQMNVTSQDVPDGVDEFGLAGLDALPSIEVAAPRVAGAPAALECRLVDLRRLTDLDGRSTGSFLVIGQVVRVHIARECLINGQFDITQAGTIGRCGYNGGYVHVNQLFQMPRSTGIQPLEMIASQKE